MPDSQLTLAEVNAKLAIGDGWTCVTWNSKHLRDEWYPPGNDDREKLGKTHPPNYCGEWDLAGPNWAKLVETMGIVDAARYVRDFLDDCGLIESTSRAELARREGEG